MRRGRTTTHENVRQLPLRFRERAGDALCPAYLPCARPLAGRAERARRVRRSLVSGVVPLTA